MTGIDDVKKVVDTINDKIGTGGQTILEGLSGIGGFLGIAGGGSLLDTVKAAIRSVFGDSDFITSIFKLIAEQLPKIIEAIDSPLTEVSDKVCQALGDLLKHVLEELEKNLPASVPNVLSAGPLQGLDALKELKELSDALGHQQIVLRIELVGNSFAAFLASAGNGDEIPVVKQLVSSLTGLLNTAVSSGGSPQLLRENLTNIVFPVDLVANILKLFLGGKKLWAWTNLPSGLPSGKLHEWLSSPGTFEYPGDRPKLMLEREFRIRLVAAFDAYVKSLQKPGDARSPLADSDDRDAAAILCQVVTIVIDTAVQFIFESECMPRLDFELPSFEAVGLRFSLAYSRQFRIAIRATIGMLLRGFWTFSVQNHVLIELISTVISVAFSAMFEAVLRNLTWSLQIVSRYKDDPLGGPRTADVLTVPSLDRAEFDFDPQGGPQQVQEVEYVVLDRFAGKSVEKNLIQSRPVIRGFVSDFAAYLDAAHSQFKVGSAFTAAATDEVTITRAQLDGRRLLVWASTSWRQPTPNTYEDPRPVLRVYTCCHSLVMKHGEIDSDTYEIDRPISVIPRGCLEVLVVSSHGGRAVQKVIVV